MAYLKFLAIILLFPVQTWAQNSLKEFERQEKLMGKAFQIVVVHSDSMFAQKALQAAVDEIMKTEALISSWNDNSETSKVNLNAGIEPTLVDSELFDLIQRCKVYHETSNGTFDISIQPLIMLWNESLEKNQIPNSQEIENTKQLVNSNLIDCNENDQSVLLKEKGMKISFGAVGKGYAAERAKKVLLKMGIENGLISAGGDIAAWGNQADGKAWGIAIQHPRAEQKGMAWLEIKDQAIVTSGDYEAFKMIDGKRYCHIIDPRNGKTANELISVTVISYNAELADAMSTAIFVLGAKEGLVLAEKIKGLEALLFTSDNKILSSSGLDISWEEN